MSYILDALRRADAERQRGQPPALQQVASVPVLTPPAPPPTVLRRLAPGLLLALATAGATGVWLMWRAPTDAAPAATRTAPPQAPASTPATARAATAPPPASAVLSQAPAAASLAAAAPPVSPPAPPARAQAAAPAPPASAPAQPRAAQSAPEPDTSPRAIVASALPEPQRSAVARLGIGGAVHSPEPGRSFVMVGGQIVREGATLAPGITLERIEPRLLQLRVGEQRVLWPL